MNLKERAEKLLAWQPTAFDIRDAGQCPLSDCDTHELVFYRTPDFDEPMVIEESRYGRSVQGGFFCPVCGFGNAGSYPLEDYEVASVYEDGA